MNEPEDPITALSETAASQHEMYMAWVEAGFTVDQAMALITAVIVEIIRGVAS